MKYFLGLSSTFSAKDTLRHTFATGAEHNLSELRAFLAAHYGATYDHVAVYANGRTALNIAIKTVARRGSKVVITSMTCYAVIQAIKTAGCVPVFADIDKKTLHFGAKELEKAIEGEKDVQAVIVQNNLGIPVDIEAIEEVAKRHKLSIIEDLAHCAGVRYPDGREAGTVGRVTVLSFGKGKSIDAVTGGAVVLTDQLDSPVKQPLEPPKFKDNFRARIYPLLCAIIRTGYRVHKKVGRGFTALFTKIHAIKRSADGRVSPDTRLTFWQCRLALSQLQSIPRHGRKPLREFYLVDDRDSVLEELEKQGYFFRDIWYDTPVAPERYFHKADFHPDACPVAAEVATEIVNLPTWYPKSSLIGAKRIIKAHLIEGEIEIPAEEKPVEAPEEAKEDKKSKKAPKLVGFYKNNRGRKKNQPKKDQQEDDLDVEERRSSKSKKKSVKDKFSQVLEKVPGSKNQEDLSELEQKSDILSAVPEPERHKTADQVAAKSKQSKNSKKSRIEAFDEEIIDEDTKTRKPRAESTEPAKPTESIKLASSKSAEPERSIKAPGHRLAPEDEDREKAHVITKSGSMPGMKVAPEKLSDREKLKAELEQGKKGNPSVF